MSMWEYAHKSAWFKRYGILCLFRQLRNTGELPKDYITKEQAKQLGCLYYEYKDNPNMDLNELLNNYLIKMNNKQRFSDFIYNITGSNERSDLKILATSYIRPPMDFLSAGCVYSSSTCNLKTENMIYGFASAFCDYYFDLANWGLVWKKYW